MAFGKTTQVANRYGLDIKIYDYTDGSVGESLVTSVDFANVSNIDLTGPMTYATGGQNHAEKVGFNDPIEGTFTISSQIMTMDLLAIAAGATAGTSVTFKNDAKSAVKYYTITATTVWKDEGGTTYSENLTFHKVAPNRALNISYSGEGDPTSVDVVFDLMQDANGNVLTVAKADIE